jgi:flagella basal body P-ring formation protein FlgA
VPAGQVLVSADMEVAAAEDPVLVKAHDSVRLVAAVGNLRVTALGEALQDGRSGQTIRVRNVDSGRVVSGHIVGPSVVEVDH